jgi:NACalpha-BTF3-like transcription factor
MTAAKQQNDLDAVTSYLQELNQSSDATLMKLAKSVLVDVKNSKNVQIPKNYLNKEQVDLLIREFEIEKSVAENALFKAQGDLQIAIKNLL